jgi:hypothetical protein
MNSPKWMWCVIDSGTCRLIDPWWNDATVAVLRRISTTETPVSLTTTDSLSRASAPWFSVKWVCSN